ncbi:MAG TPA: hypothetical protein VJN64_09430 [Terriglobales bacterium]|nr:hypothetical protein [Terriglobales bacterium]
MSRVLWFPYVALVCCATVFAQTAIHNQEGDPDDDIVSAIPLNAPIDTSIHPGPGSPTGTGRPPRIGVNQRVNALQQPFPNGLLGRSETTITGTTDGQNVLAGWNDAQGFCGPPFGVACTPAGGLSGFGFSTNGGATFTDGGAPFIQNHIYTRGDPWMDLGGLDNNTFFYANLAVDDVTAANLGVSVHRGHFSATGFNFEDVTAFNATNTPHDLYDKEAIATAKDSSGAGIVTVTNFISVCGFDQAGSGQIEVWRTHNGGATWEGPAIAAPDTTTPNNINDPNCGATQILQQSSAPAIGPNGEMYAVWQFGPTFTATTTSTNADIFFTRSLDGGVTFSTPKSLAAINSFRQDPPVGYSRDRMNDHPRIAVATTGPNRGRVYVVFYSALAPVTAATASHAACLSPPTPTSRCRPQRLTSSQVFLKFSDDQGQTWSNAIALAPAPPATGVKRWWPVVNVEPSGNVDVIFNQSLEQPVASGALCTINVGGGIRRQGTAHSLVDIYWVQSTNGGSAFGSPVKASSATNDWCTAASNITPNFGDYIGSFSGGNRVFAAWGDSRSGAVDVEAVPILGAGKSK